MLKVLSPQFLVYAIPLMMFLSFYIKRRSKQEKTNHNSLKTAHKEGLTEPASLHPVIKKALCIGCGSCVKACPEGDVLGLIRGKSTLINATYCIGHGACKTACPVDAISLVFGTAKRGVDIPLVKDNFETNVPGIFIAGELGGMGLIRNAITQGRQAMESIAKLDGMGKLDLDVVIIGAGPAGFAAALMAKKKELNYIVVEQESFGGTVAHFPRGKVVMTAPVDLPLVGKVKFRETTKEALLEFWDKVRNKTQIKVKYNERVDQVEQQKPGFVVATTKGSYKTRSILLAIGRRGTPRKLGVPGEEQSKVVYRLIDPEQYRNQQVLVVGGGDAAIEAATSIAEEDGTTVTISYRSEAFGRAKEKNRQKVQQLEQQGKLNVLMSSQVEKIEKSEVIIKHNDASLRIANDGIIVCAGGILPTKFLQSMGVSVDKKFGTQ